MRRVLILTVIAAAAPPGHAELGTCPPSPSKVIFPTQVVPLSFSHVDHLALKLSCDFCHENAPDSTSSSDNLIPAEETCTTCHEIERDKPNKQVDKGEPDARCVSCHPGWDAVGAPPRVVIPKPNLKFNHKVHVDRKIRCQTCHGDFVKDGVHLATRENLPMMTTCLDCHDGKQAASKCTTCHLQEPGGFVKTSYPEGTLAPSGVLRGDAHDPAFRLDHKGAAKGDEKYCQNCHKRDFCIDCHDGKTKPLDFHGNDYVTLHPVQARRNDPDCGACHRRQTFCSGCHARSGVSDHDKTSEFQQPSEVESPRNLFHPAGWQAGHQVQAQRNIKACASCHREEFCTGCHMGGSGLNPHGVRWAGSARCESLLAKNKRMCMKCHPTSVPSCD